MEGVQTVTPEEKRRKRIQELATWIHDAPKGQAVRERIEGKAGYLWGCKVETVREYLEVLDRAGLVSVGDLTIYWVGKE